jgi:hypothetical protein
MDKKTPYPGFNPSFKNVKKRNGNFRTVLVLEVLSKKQLTQTIKALIGEQVEAKLEQLMGRNGLIDYDVVSDDRFDVLLQEGLRIVTEGY